ncbi:hypothetical protein CSIRO_1252 [Bradyrhizobiaceae bacterium SG-6C]|nr:hypothetical protein CSIRO_1252 [Bradyrhizobiaceae bacterium SG-6C]
MWQKRLKKRLSGWVKQPPWVAADRRPDAALRHGRFVHFQFDTLARVCFVCIPSGKGPG